MRSAFDRFCPRKWPADPPSLPLGAESVGVRWGNPQVRIAWPPTSPSLSPLKGGEGQRRELHWLTS